MKLKTFTAALLASQLIHLALPVQAQDARADVSALVETARAAAADEHTYLFAQLCASPIEFAGAAAAVVNVPGALPANDPDRDWYTEPAQVFDDLYYLGQSAFSAWALRTSDGIILVDAIFENTVEAEVVDGMRKLGIDPAELKYVIISHAHADHSGGAGVLQQLGAHVIMSADDWDLYDATSRETVKATRDIVANDGFSLTLGDHTVRTFLTPGHTHGTLSTVFQVHDNGVPHMAAVWGGTAFNFRDTPDDPRDLRLGAYARSAVYFQGIAAGNGAEVILSNHPTYDGSTVKIPALRERQRSMPHPFVIGTDSVLRYLQVAEDCALATRIVEQQ